MKVIEARNYLIKGDSDRIAKAVGISRSVVNQVRRGTRQNKLVEEAIIQLAEKRRTETKTKIEAL